MLYEVITPKIDKSVSSDMAAGAWGGSDILRAEKKDKGIDFSVSKDKTIAYESQKVPGLDAEVRDIKEAQDP